MERSKKSLRGLCAGVVAAILAISAAQTLSAQSEGTDIRYIEFQSVKVREDGKKRIIELKAKTSVLPVGCKVEFLLTWRYQIVERFVVEVPADRRFSQDFPVKSYVPSPEPYAIHTQIVFPLEDQPKSVRQAIEADPKTFPPGAGPWAEYHEEHKFVLGSEAEIRAELDRVKTWFKERYTQLGRLDVLVDTNADAATAGTDFANSQGEFDAKKWRSMLDGEVLKPLKDLQKEIEEGLAGKQGDLIAYRRPLAELRELANAVAWRAVDRSMALYEAKGLEPAPEDAKPEGLATTVRGFKRSPPKGSDLARLVKKIDEAIDPPKAETPPAPETPPVEPPKPAEPGEPGKPGGSGASRSPGEGTS